MNILFVHNNFPGQFGHLARILQRRGHNVQAIGGHPARGLPELSMHKYRQDQRVGKDTHAFARRFEADCLRGAGAGAVALELRKRGYRPDVIYGHPGWGEMLFLQDVWPTAKVIVYAEYFNRIEGSHVGFDPEFDQRNPFEEMQKRSNNAAMLLSLASADVLISATEWQRDRHPESMRSRILVVHDGIDTEAAQPRADGRLQIPNGPLLTAGDEVVTYINRHLEPMRGIHVFLRALPEIMAARPQSHIVIIGSDKGIPYGPRAPGGGHWKQLLLNELGDRLDASRVHWMDWVSRNVFLDALSVSRAHVYLSYPFVLSWSLLEAMAAGCTVIASATDPVREMMEDGRHGMLVDFFDRAALVDRVVDALSKPRDAFAHLHAAARQRMVERYSRPVCVPRLIELVENG